MTTPQANTAIRLRRRRIVLAVYLVGWIALTHWPKPPHLPPIPGGDKTIHALGYLLAAVLLQSALAGEVTTRRLAAIALIVFAGLDEATQGLVARTASTADWLADALGVALGSIVAGPTRALLKTINNKYL